jgi:flagellin-specific chaperone FliS
MILLPSGLRIDGSQLRELHTRLNVPGISCSDMNQPRWGYSIVAAIAFVMLVPTAFIHEEAFAHQEHIDFITNSEYIKGHLEKAIENKEAEDIELAIAHAGHPIEEVFTLMEGPLSEASPQRATELKAALEALPNSITSDTAQVVSQKVAAINGMLDEAIVVFAGEEAEELATKAGVISGLLETAAIEYEEAVVDGQIVEMIEYQDASAFISRANAVFGTIQSEIDAEEAEEISGFFEQLESSLQANADPENVETLLDGIIHELGEAVPSADVHVEFAANLEYIRGHLDQAVANKEAGSNELAIAHAGHPVEEVYALIEAEIEEHDAELNAQLEDSLTGLANQINTMTAAQVQTEVSEINSMLDQAETAVLGDEMSDPKFGGMVAIAVLETAELEYEEAIANGEIVEMIEYQDSTAFISQAEGIFTSIREGLPEHEAGEIAEFFEQLNSLTASNASFEQVETMIGGIIHEFEEALGLESGEEQELDGWGYIDRIKGLLDQSVAEYREGNAQQAKALAIEAYLDNYEFIESDIAEENRELMEKIEVDMRVELVEMIDAGEPATEVESQVEAIKTDLETARGIVIPEFPLAAVAIAAGMTAFVVFAIRMKGSAIFRGSPV